MCMKMKNMFYRCKTSITLLILISAFAYIAVASSKSNTGVSLFVGLLSVAMIVHICNNIEHIAISTVFMKYGVGYEPFIFGLLLHLYWLKSFSKIDALENKLYTLSTLMYLSNLLGIYILNEGEFKVWSKDDIKGYAKLNSMHRMINKGLNVHTFIPCRTVEEIVYAYKELGCICTIRTDKLEVGQNKQLKFYKADRISESQLVKIANEIVKDGCIAIVANGLRYDKYLRYNAVYKLKESGSFIIEYSRKNVPLRNMYNYPDELNTIIGNINDNIRDWKVNKAKNEKDRVDLREIKELLLEEYWVCEKNKIMSRYIEMSTYTKEVGPLKQRKVYWEV